MCVFIARIRSGYHDVLLVLLALANKNVMDALPVQGGGAWLVGRSRHWIGRLKLLLPDARFSTQHWRALHLKSRVRIESTVEQV